MAAWLECSKSVSSSRVYSLLPVTLPSIMWRLGSRLMLTTTSLRRLEQYGLSQRLPQHELQDQTTPGSLYVSPLAPSATFSRMAPWSGMPRLAIVELWRCRRSFPWLEAFAPIAPTKPISMISNAIMTLNVCLRGAPQTRRGSVPFAESGRCTDRQRRYNDRHVAGRGVRAWAARCRRTLWSSCGAWVLPRVELLRRTSEGPQK